MPASAAVMTWIFGVTTLSTARLVTRCGTFPHSNFFSQPVHLTATYHFAGMPKWPRGDDFTVARRGVSCRYAEAKEGNVLLVAFDMRGDGDPANIKGSMYAAYRPAAASTSAEIATTSWLSPGRPIARYPGAGRWPSTEPAPTTFPIASAPSPSPPS